MTNFYTTGGNLLPDAPSYVPRQADTDLYHALKQGQFCYILNSRQMGKSSLTVRVANRLRDDGIIVVVFELSSLGTQLTIEQWYDGLVLKVGEQLNLENELDDFWYDNENLGLAQRLEQALRRVVLAHYQQSVVICFDEIDSVRSLPFATDDFFATIRSCYNERAHNPDLQRLTFCLVGTARPTDLITDKQTTPFDIGQAIELTGFTFEEAMPLAQGLQGKADNPEAVLRAILDWTGGQPFLTQKVCDLFCRHTDTPLARGQETAYVAQLIQTHIIEHWESKDDPPHLTTIRNRLIERDNRKDTWQLLGLCRYILSLSQPEEMREAQANELRLTGLMVKQASGQLRVFNKIYEQVFNQHWLAQAQRETLAENPYLGLSAFQAEDAERFFGREELTARLLEKCSNLYTAQPRLLPILGPSGSGKSSVARAGLIPALKRLPDNFQVEIFTPTEFPLKELARIVASIQDIDSIDKIDEIERLLRAQDNTLLKRVETFTAPLVLLIDQFEEIYTLCEDAADGTAFIDNLITAVQPESKKGLLVILTLRSDFLGATQRHGLLNQIIARQAVIVPMMSEAELRDAIGKPAEQAGHPLELATVDLLVDQAAGREGALPLLQFALMDLWAGLRKGVEPSETLRQIGGVGGALAGKAEDIYQGLSAAKKRVARRVFLKLIQLGEGTKDTRRRVKIIDMVAHGENENIVHAILSRFAQPDARLVTLSKDKQDHKTAEVTHEALLENWQTLKDWLADSRDDLRFEHRLNDAINNWQRQHQAVGLLWRSPDLELLHKYYQQAHQDMTAVQVGFYQASARKQEQTQWLKRVTVAVLVGLTVASAIGFYLISIERKKAQEAEQKTIIAMELKNKALQAEKKANEAALIAQQERNKAKESEQLARKAFKIATESEFRDRLFDGSEGPEMIRIPAGRFQMGNIQNNQGKWEKPVHWVTIETFAISRYEVTFAEYGYFIEKTARKTLNNKNWVPRNHPMIKVSLHDTGGGERENWSRNNHPVTNISWRDAVAYADWLSQQTGHKYRLPTEAEWEYAARAGTETSRYWGNDPDKACTYANVKDKTLQGKDLSGIHNCIDGYAYTAPVGRFIPNAFGLFDMLGNVWEWTCSEYSEYPGKEKQCVAKESTNLRMIRGGSWGNSPMYNRVTVRSRFQYDYKGDTVGFRLVRVVF